jgi:hypothetical protein
MSLYSYIGVDIELSVLDVCIKTNERGRSDFWFEFYNDDFEIQDKLKSLFGKKYVYAMSPHEFFCSKTRLIELRKKKCELRDELFQMVKESLESELIRCERFFEYLRQILPIGTNAKIYTIYINNPNFSPKGEMNIDLKTFVMPNDFEFAEDVLYIICNGFPHITPHSFFGSPGGGAL